jgi:hypothetical protein
MGEFRSNLAFGRVGEGLISRWLQSRGHMVFPAYEKEIGRGKGPQLFSASGDLVLPDILAFCGPRIQWVEAKHKTCFTWHRISQKWTTGIDLRHYGEYQEVAARTSLPVWLMFWHPKSEPDARDIAHGCPDECPVGLFGNDLAFLADCENHRSDKWGKSGMVYWAHDRLKLIASVSDMEARA